MISILSDIKNAKVFIVDDHDVVREGLRRKINRTPSFHVCGEAGDGETALTGIQEAKPDIVTVDLSLKGMNGLELIKKVRSQWPSLPILVVSMLDESVYAERVLRAGAQGYIMKEESIDRMMDALKEVLRGKIYLSEKLSSAMLSIAIKGKKPKEDLSVSSLSDRELEVFRLLGKGFKVSKIAEALNLSVKTVESYRNQIKTKLDIPSTEKLNQFAIQWMKVEI